MKVCTREEEEQRNYRSQYFYDYIEKTYEYILEKDKSIHLLFQSYLMFLIEVKQNPTKCYVQIFTFMSTIKNKSIVIEQRIQVILDILIRNAQENKLINRDDKNILLQENIVFDEQLNESLKQLRESLELKRKALLEIGQDSVDFNQILQLFSLSRDKRKLLFDNLLKLIQKGYENRLLDILIETYERSLSFSRQLTKAVSKYRNKMQIDREVQLNRIYNDNSCTIYASLCNQLGEIKKVSNNFERVLGIMNNKEIIGKNISILQPNAVGAVHNKILRNYLSKYTTDKSSIQLLTIGIDNNGWAIAYDIKVQLSLKELNDIGMSALIQPINDDNLYISINLSNNSQIIAISEYIYATLLKSTITTKQIYKTSVQQFMPAFNQLFFKYKDELQRIRYTNNQFETIAFRPSNSQFFKKDFHKLSQQEKIQQLISMDTYIIKGEFNFIDNLFIQIAQCKITEMYLIENNNFKIEQIQQLVYNLKYFSHQGQEEQETILDQNEKIEDFDENIVLKDILKQNTVQFVSSINELKDLQLDDNKIPNSAYYLQDSERNRGLEITSLRNIPRQFESEQNIQDFPPEILSYNDIDITKFSQQIISPKSNQMLINNKKSVSFTSFPKDDEKTVQISLISKQRNQFNEINSDETSIQNKNEKQFAFSPRQKQKHQSTLFPIQEQFVQEQQNKQEVPTSRQKQHKVKSNQLLSETKVSIEDIYSKEEEEKFKQNFHDGSVQTSKSGYTIFRQQFIDKVQQKDKFAGLTIVRILGCASLLGFLLLNVANYYVLDRNLLMQRDDYINIDWGSKVRRSLSELIGDNNILKLITKIEQFQLPPDRQTKLINLISLQHKQRYEQFKNLMINYVKSNKEQTEMYHTVQQLNQNFTFGYTISKYDHQILQFGYTQLVMLGYMYQTTHGLDPKFLNDLQIGLNYVEIAEKLDELKQHVTNDLKEHFDELRVSALYALIFIMITTFIFSLGFLPIYSFIQKRREEILFLLTTFSPQKLSTMLRDNVLSIAQIDTLIKIQFSDQQGQVKQDPSKFMSSYYQKVSQAINSQVTNSSKGLIKKRKNISTSNKLPSLQLKVIVFSIIFFLVNLIHPVSSYFLIKDFCEIEIGNRQFVDNFYGMNDYIISLSNIRPPLILLKLSKDNQKYQLYFNRANTLYSQIDLFQQNVIKEVTSLIQTNKYMKKEFDEYVFGILEKDSCQIVSENLDLLKNGFNKEKCYSINNRIFSQGIIKSVKFFLELFKSRWTAYEIQNPKLFLQEIQRQERDFNIEEIYDFRIYLNYILSSIYKFIEQLSIDHYNQMLRINRALISISIFTFIISIYVAYYKFFEKSIDQLRLTKQLLDIIDIHALEENQYILTYLKLQK